ncbi:MAG: PKHD-type hydroxylase [Pseudohongiella sp.]|nr:MAG: PKHD-type hydroxylase [Pseudohongiella sp.]
MFIHIPKLLNSQQLAFIDELIASAQFVDGKSSAGVTSREVKQNEQLDLRDEGQLNQLVQILSESINASASARTALMPRRMTAPVISRYRENMDYGWHIDNAMMAGVGVPVRADIACTLFLKDSKDYVGGELEINSSSGNSSVKLERGDAFFYPAGTRHRVNPVTSGERQVLVFWIQSLIADTAKRELLYDLGISYENVYRENPESPALLPLQKSQASLLRMWAEP